MQRATGRVLLVLTLWLGYVVEATAGYNVDVQKKSSFSDSVGTIAVLPAACPASVDCVWLNRKLAEILAKRRNMKYVSMDTVRQVMFDESISTIDDSNRMRLAEKLGADSFLVTIVGHSGTESSDAVVMPIGNSFYVAESSVSQGALQVHIVAATGGDVLLSGSGHGESEFRQPKGVLAKIFAEILVRAFP